jgi:plasmid replication initiation protein
VGNHADDLKVPFLNYMANIRNRAGHGAVVRVGGNTQESSTFYEQGTDDGSMIEKIKEEGASVVSRELSTSVVIKVDRG